MIEHEIELIGKAFPLKMRDSGEYATIEKFGMTIKTGWYAAEGLGNVSTLTASGAPGMAIDTLIIDPFDRDVPLLSLDSMVTGEQLVGMAELYDTLLSSPDAEPIARLQAVKDSYATLPDQPLGEHWYDSMKLAPSTAKCVPAADAERIVALRADFLEAYLNWARACEPCTDPQAKRAKAAAYVDGLFAQGGPSTDQFSQMLGADAAQDMFSRIMFGTKE